jgi:hypothetical protein
MKPKNFKKKLSLRKTTIVDLEATKMAMVQAGAATATATGETCMICDSYWSCNEFKCIWQHSCAPCP